MSQSAWIYNYGEMCGGVRAWRVGGNDPVLTKLVLGCHLALLLNLTAMPVAVQLQRGTHLIGIFFCLLSCLKVLVKLSFITDVGTQMSHRRP